MCPKQMEVNVKIERRGVSHKRCETKNSFPLYKAETIFNKKFNSKVAQVKGVLIFFFISVMWLLL